VITYIVRRLLYAIPVLAVSSFLIFVFVSTTTDPLEAIKMNPRASQRSIHLVEHEHHLDRPVVVRYGYWVRDVFTASSARRSSRTDRSFRTSSASSAIPSSSSSPQSY